MRAAEMSFRAPNGWQQDSDKLFIHTTGAWVHRTTYRSKEGWFIIPTDLDQAVLEFEPTPEGRDKAFETFAANALNVKTKRKTATAAKKSKTKAAAKEEDEEKPKEASEDGESEEDEGDEA